MNLLVFTPLGAESPVARFMAETAGSLVEAGHGVTVVATDTVEREAVGHRIGVHLLGHAGDSDVLAAEADADLIVYNVGNSYADFGGALGWLPRLSGYVIAHDIFLGDLLAAYGRAHPDRAAWLVARNSPSLYGRGMPWHRPEGSPILLPGAEALWSEWILNEASALIAHSRFARDLLRTSARKHVELLPAATTSGTPASAARQPRRPEGQVVVSLTAPGSAHRLTEVAYAIGTSRTLRDAVRWRVAGRMAERERTSLDTLCTEIGVKVEMLGDGADVRADLATADLITAVTHPLLGGPITAVAEAMRSGTPVVIDQGGIFADLPSANAIALPDGELQVRLAQLLASIVVPGRGLREAAAMESIVGTTVGAEGYGRALVELARRSMRRDRRRLDAHFSNISTWDALDLENPASVFAADMAIFS